MLPINSESLSLSLSQTYPYSNPTQAVVVVVVANLKKTLYYYSYRILKFKKCNYRRLVY